MNSIGQITFNFLQNIIITSCSWNGQSLFQGIQIIGALLLSVNSTDWKAYPTQALAEVIPAASGDLIMRRLFLCRKAPASGRE